MAEKAVGFSRFACVWGASEYLSSSLVAKKSEKQENFKAFQIKLSMLSERVLKEIMKLTLQFKNKHLKLSETLTQKL
jgi:hypothetical protein